MRQWAGPMASEAFDGRVWIVATARSRRTESSLIGIDIGWRTLGSEALAELGLPANAARPLDELLRRFAASAGFAGWVPAVNRDQLLLVVERSRSSRVYGLDA